MQDKKEGELLQRLCHQLLFLDRSASDPFRCALPFSVRFFIFDIWSRLKGVA